MDKMKAKKIGYLGPRGSFSEEAASIFGKSQDLIPFSSSELTEALEKDSIQKAVLPIENLIDGSVNWVLDLLLMNNIPFVIESEIILAIKHNLIGFGKISDIGIIYSHPQVLGQCAKFTKSLKVKTIDTDSTSAAVQLMAQKRNSKLAAIGTKRAAEIYGVPVIEEDISDIPNNQTRFIVLGREQIGKSGADKTSFIFSTENKPGALYKALEVFAVLKINMTMIFSRPSKTKLGEYVFFADIEGHQKDEKVKAAFEQIRNRTSFLKVLGSYPRAK